MTILILIIGLSLLIFIHELGHFLVAKRFGLYVEEFGFGFPPKLFSWKRGETVYSVNLLPFGGFVKIYGERSDVSLLDIGKEKQIPQERSFAVQNVYRRAAIIVAGVIMNFLMGWVILSAIFVIGAQGYVVVTQVTPDSPAALAGFLPGDQFVDFEKSANFIAFVKESRGREISFAVLRSGERITVTATPDVNPPEGRGALGVALADSGIPKYDLLQSVWEGLKQATLITGKIFESLGTLIVGIFTGTNVLKQFVGPVGIVQVASDTAHVGFIYLWQLIALISLNLAVLNVLPFPALDGGRLFFLIIEKLKGSPISPKKEMIANAIGMALLLLLMVVITVRDVARLF